MVQIKLTKENFYIITGGPGAGKTTLLLELEKQGIKCVHEVARQIIKEQVSSGGDALPWANRALYKRLMFERSIEDYISTNADRPVLFDRGIPDTLTYSIILGEPYESSIKKKADNFRYNKHVFMLPPWEEIYTADEERKQTYEEAMETYEINRDVYIRLGYVPIELTKTDIKNRAQFIVDFLAVTRS